MATGLNGSESADFYRDDGGCTIRPAPVFSDEKEDPNRCVFIFKRVCTPCSEPGISYRDWDLQNLCYTLGLAQSVAN